MVLYILHKYKQFTLDIVFKRNTYTLLLFQFKPILQYSPFTRMY